jgi:adenylosuccinate lyase
MSSSATDRLSNTAAHSLTAVSPIDGRYAGKTASLRNYFSEFGLIQYRVRVEIEYFIALIEFGIPQLSDFPSDKTDGLRGLVDDFTAADAQAIKDIEKVTNHDVKAVEYWIKQEFDKLELQAWKEFVHFGLTSQDINNTAVPMSVRHASIAIYEPGIQNIIDLLSSLALEWKEIPMLARTHGQPASPTKLGKELEVFVVRLRSQFKSYKAIAHSGKFGGATGNLNAHIAAFPEHDWTKFATDFLKNSLDLQRQQPTTQIEHYDGLSERFDAMKRINIILLDLCRDVWTYVSMDYFKQKIKKGEVGSSAMPHKVNPIDFENAEGNIGIANALLEHLSSKLPVSRLQRDLTDSTVTRAIGLPWGHTLIAFQSIEKGLAKLLLNRASIQADLDANWAVLAEPIQTILRREAYPDPYEALKALTRTGAKITEETLSEFIAELDVSESVKKELVALRPETYTGNA